MSLINDIIRRDSKATKSELKIIIKQFVASDFSDLILDRLKNSELLRLAAIGIYIHFEKNQMGRTLIFKKIAAVIDISETSLSNWFPKDEKPFVLLIKSV